MNDDRNRQIACGNGFLLGETLAVLLAGGSGERLHELTGAESKPALPMGGRYRNIFNPELGEFLDIWPAQKDDTDSWYQGTADAVFQNLSLIETHNPKFVLVLAADHVYKMDYLPLLKQHELSGADVTVACAKMPLGEACHFGVMQTDVDQKIERFVEKPGDGSAYSRDGDSILASMGVYVFSTPYLLRCLREDAVDSHSRHDFGGDLIPRAVRERVAWAYSFVDQATHQPGYWRDVGTLDAYWQTNMDLLGSNPRFDLDDEEQPIRSERAQRPPARFVFHSTRAPGTAIDSIVADGCVVDGAQVNRSVLFNCVRVGKGSHINEAVLLPGARVGKNCSLNKVIVGSGVCIPDGIVIGEDQRADSDLYRITEGGVVVVSKVLDRSSGDQSARPQRAEQVDTEQAESLSLRRVG